MIIASALVPHTPLLIPTIGKDAREQMKKTIEGLHRLKEHFAQHNPDTVILIKTPERGRRRKTAFQIQLPAKYTIDLNEFGDLMTKGEFVCDTVLGTELKTRVRDSKLSLTYVSTEPLEYTASVPLLALFGTFPVKVIIVQPPQTDYETLFAFGTALTATLQESSKRIICIAAGDCAHCTHKGKKQSHEQVCLPFDYMFMDALQKKSPDALLAMKPEEVRTLNACAVPPALVLHGILDSLSWNARLISYEAPFGVGYCVMEYSV